MPVEVSSVCIVNGKAPRITFIGLLGRWYISKSLLSPILILRLSSNFISLKVEIPEWIAPDACAWIFTLPPVSFRAVASIPVKDAPLPWNDVAVMTPAFPS